MLLKHDVTAHWDGHTGSQQEQQALKLTGPCCWLSGHVQGDEGMGAACERQALGRHGKGSLQWPLESQDLFSTAS